MFAANVLVSVATAGPADSWPVCNIPSSIMNAAHGTAGMGSRFGAEDLDDEVGEAVDA